MAEDRDNDFGQDEPAEQDNVATEDVQTPPEDVMEDATDWQQVAQDRYDQLIRLQADFDNFRRRMDREREELRGFVTGAILKDFLPVYDNLERALKFMPQNQETQPWRAGLEMTLKGFNEVFNRFGVTPIVTVGEPFNPRVHEAVQQVDSAQPEGIIVEELLKGFQWREQVLRASLVKVSTGQGSAEEEESLPE